MKLAVIYFSVTGNTSGVAEYMADGMRRVEGTEARTISITDVDADYVRSCCGVVFGSPTYAAGPAAEFYSWFEKNGAGLGLAGKLGGAFATGQYVHGGEDVTIQTIQAHLLVKGMMVYSGGGAYGRPIIHLGPVEISPNKEDYKDVFEIFGERFATQAKRIFGERAEG